MEGTPLEPGAWMVTVGEGLMMATASAWILKNMTLNDWLLYSERNGRPGLRAITAAAPDSAEWNALETALSDILNGSAVIHSSADDIKVIDLAAGGNIPFPDLVERIDRMIAALWRGADLSTMSRDRGYGASLQEKETCTLEEDDAEMLTETLNEYVDAWVIRHVFGEQVKPLANVKVLVSPKECTAEDLKIDEFLVRHGAKLSIQETMSRYGRAMAKNGEEVLSIPARIPEQKQTTERKGENHLTAENARIAKNPTTDRTDRVDPDLCPLVSSVVQNPEPSLASLSSVPQVRNFEQEQTEETEQIHLTAENANEVPPLCSPCLSGESGSSFSPVPSVQFQNEFVLLQSDWVQLSPYGDFSHARGLQRVDRAAADTMVARFNSFRGRLGRLFGGVPFYIGHPDLPNASELADRKAYGWVVRLEAREDGIYGQVKWSDAGLELLKQAHFKYLSPYWDAREIGTDNGRRVFQPVSLVSVGLTNQPNIPVRPLANETEGDFTTEATEDAENSEPDGPEIHHRGAEVTENMQNSGCGSEPDGHLRSADSQIRADEQKPTKHAVLPSESSVVKNSDSSSSRCSPCLGGESVAVPSVVKQPTSICPTVKSRRGIRLQNMHTRSVTQSIGERRGERVPLANMERRRARIQEAVQAKVRLGLSYNDAWIAVKRENRTWFE